MDAQGCRPDERAVSQGRARALSLRALLGTFLVSMAAACAGPGTQSPATGGGFAAAPAVHGGQALVFGRFEITRDGKEQAVATLNFTWKGVTAFHVIVLPEGASRALALELNEQGRFHWKLDPGTYRLLALEAVYGRQVLTGSITGRFSVAEGDGAVYIGHLKVDIANGVFTGELRDAQEEALPALRAQAPDLVAGSAKRMLQAAEREGTYAKVRSICARDWGVECTRELQGVAPLRPRLDQGLRGIGFTAIDSLQPALAWSPSPVEGITYDVAIWEAVSYRVSALASPRYLPGPLVAYGENLARAEFVPPTALKPRSRYFWSVRLRRGDTVSSWSRAGHFTFLIVAASSGSGEWFGFETP